MKDFLFSNDVIKKEDALYLLQNQKVRTGIQMSSTSPPSQSLNIALFRLETRAELALGMTELETWVAKEKSQKRLDKPACYSMLLSKLQKTIDGLLGPFLRRNQAQIYRQPLTEELRNFLQRFSWGASSEIFKSLASGIFDLVYSNSEVNTFEQEHKSQKKEPLEDTSLFDLIPIARIIEQAVQFVVSLIAACIQRSQDWARFESDLYNLVNQFRITLEPHFPLDDGCGVFSSPLTHLLKQTFFLPLIKSEILDVKILSLNQSWNRLWESFDIEASDIADLVTESSPIRAKTADAEIQTNPSLSPVLRRANTSYSQQSTGLPLSNSQTPINYSGMDKISKQRGDIITSSFESIAFQDLPLQSQASQYSSASQSEISSRDLWSNSMNEDFRSITFKPQPLKKKKKKRTHTTPDKREKKEYQTPQPKSEKQSARFQAEQEELIDAQFMLRQSPKRVFSNSVRMTLNKEEPCKVLFPEANLD